MRNLIFIYCGEDGQAAKELAVTLRKDDTNVNLGSASEYKNEIIDADSVIIMPDVASFRRDEIVKAYQAEGIPVDIREKPNIVFMPPKRRGRPPKIRSAMP